MSAPKVFYIVASDSGRYLAGITLDLEVTMFELKSRPREGGKGVEFFGRLIHFEEYPTAMAAEARLGEWLRWSGRKKRKFVHQVNKRLADQSATWFPVHAAPSAAFQPLDYPGQAQGGVSARLSQGLPPRSDSASVNPLDVMSLEDQIACGVYKKLAIGAGT